MRRLHLQIFGALALTGLLCLIVTATVAYLHRDESRHLPRMVHDLGAFILADLPEHDRAAFAQQLAQRAGRLRASISVWDRSGRLWARAGKPLGPDQLGPLPSSKFRHRDGSVQVRLDDGRTLAIVFEGQPQPFSAGRLLLALGLLLGTLLLGSYLAARRITRRLEQLEQGVTRFGEGELDLRVAVRGRDEIARLAAAFNRSCERIAGLLRQQRRMLQSASHELRSPLSRLRMALELAVEPTLPSETRERLRSEATRDIEELDALIGDLLLAGRLADSELRKDFAPVALGEVVESEALRVSALAEVQPLVVAGDARMLRSLVRNLLENARRYGRDPVRAKLAQVELEAVLRVEDAGDGVSPDERARIFEPFYRPPGHREGKDGGVGLGLALVKHIAEHHGGQVRYCEGELGSCFEVRLPAAEARSRH